VLGGEVPVRAFERTRLERLKWSSTKLVFISSIRWVGSYAYCTSSTYLLILEYIKDNYRTINVTGLVCKFFYGTTSMRVLG